MSKLKVKIKAEGKDAENVIHTLNGLPPRTNNYVSNDNLFIPSGANSDKQKGSERLPASTQAPRPGEARQDRSDSEYKAHAFPSASVNPIDDASAATRLKPTSVGGAYEKLPANHPEHDRQHNNRCRDARTNLGRGKQAIVEIE